MHAANLSGNEEQLVLTSTAKKQEYTTISPPTTDRDTWANNDTLSGRAPRGSTHYDPRRPPPLPPVVTR